MTQSLAQKVQITCPNCNTPFQTQIFTIVDVTRQPELKQALLNGQLNVAVCPNCQMATMLGTPLIYHDASKQLLLAYVPQELNLSQEQEEHLIGDATSAIMQTLPQDTPRGHLFTPRRVMSLASLIDSVLEADGIPREVLEQQRKRVELISTLAAALPEEQEFNRLVEEHRAEMSAEFFATIDAFIQASVQEGQNESAQVLQMLRGKLAEMTGFSGEQQTTGESSADMQQLIERLAGASDDALEEIIGEVRPELDYSFFQAWTERIEALQAEGQTEEAQRLTSRRQQILELIERMDQEAQAMFEAGSSTLRDILAAPDAQAAMRERREEINEAFMLVLSANIAQAQRTGREDMVARMEQISQMAIELIQESLPPEERLINQLMMADTQEERGNLLRGNIAMVSVDFVKKLNELADQQAKQGMQEQSDKLRTLAREAGAMVF
jgi:hypothetical protein